MLGVGAPASLPKWIVHADVFAEALPVQQPPHAVAVQLGCAPHEHHRSVHVALFGFEQRPRLEELGLRSGAGPKRRTSSEGLTRVLSRALLSAHALLVQREEKVSWGCGCWVASAWLGGA